MHIRHFEIANFRKLLAVRIDIADETTLFVGANNSGKTSAMLALRHFLVSPKGFSVHDFTVSHLPAINAIGEKWLTDRSLAPIASDWDDVLPSLDVWLDVKNDELHYVKDLIPTLDWEEGLLGVRVRFEPTDLELLRKDFLEAHDDVDETKKAVTGYKDKTGKFLKLWPENLVAFLERKLQAYFSIRSYTLDPAKLQAPLEGLAQPQELPREFEPVDGNPLLNLVRIDDIGAQRGFTNADNEDAPTGGQYDKTKLSDQLRRYYRNHLDTLERPGVADLDALIAIEDAQRAFDEQLAKCFENALTEVSQLGYPGITDPKIKFSTRVRPVDGLAHDTAVQYQVGLASDGDTSLDLHLPEHYNGLGFQNLISMIFRLMGFRDGWMRVGKQDSSTIKPIHLVLVEEPEAHLHAQVQQVFIKKAYTVLRAHENLGENPDLTTQLIVSTHSSYVAHELPFLCLRYFRRLPSGKTAPIPVSSVVNLTEVFGDASQTKDFVTRYLKTQHCDLFFADAVILVEGPAERMLVPHFIRKQFPILHQSYITLLEIGGSHAHRLRPLIDHLGLFTLVITDLDAVERGSGKSMLPAVGQDQVSANSTLKDWHPALSSVDDLLAVTPDAKVLEAADGKSSVRIAYQSPINVEFGGKTLPATGSTFEDALAFENQAFIKELEGDGLARKFKTAFTDKEDLVEIAKALFEALDKGKKAEFALDVLNSENFDELTAPAYIFEGLAWLQSKFERTPSIAEELENEVAKEGVNA